MTASGQPGGSGSVPRGMILGPAACCWRLALRMQLMIGAATCKVVADSRGSLRGPTPHTPHPTRIAPPSRTTPRMNTSSLAAGREADAVVRRFRYFPGWTMVGVSAAAQFMSAPGQSYSVAAFKEPMRESLGVSETSYSLAYAFATIVSGSLLPYTGRLIDRHGARRVLPIVAFLLGWACLAMSRVSGSASLYVGFSCVRSLGQGALSLIAAWLVGEWFARRRGFATAVSGLGGSLSVMSIPLLNIFVIRHFGWETAWVVLALAVWVGLLLPALFLVRDRPEDLGLLPDGDVAEPIDDCFAETVPEPAGETPAETTGEMSGETSGEMPVTSASETQGERPSEMPARDTGLLTPDWTVKDVVRDPTFWKLLAVPATSGMVGTGLVFHAVSLLGSRGVPAGWALALISFQAIIATCVALLAGWLTDRCQARYLLSAAMLLLAVGSSTVLVMPFPMLAIFYGVVLGLHGSILRSTGMVVWMTYYGREHQGAIRGIAMAVMIFAAAAGPLPLALSIDWFGTYDTALYIFVAIPLAAAGLVWTAGPPRAAVRALG